MAELAVERMSRICGRDLSSLTGAPSPFGRIVALGHYDGPTSGVAECRDCPEAYRFEMLAWDAGQDLRVYSLAPLPPDSATELIRAIGAPNPPHWPVWVPTWRFASREREQGAQREVDRVLNRADPARFVIASADLATAILAARHLTPVDLTTVTDWFSFLGLEGSRQAKGTL